jgi:hypothetical protein
LDFGPGLVPAAGIEPATSRSGGERSNPLSYAGNSCLQEKIAQHRSACHASLQTNRQDAKSAKQLKEQVDPTADGIAAFSRPGLSVNNLGALGVLAVRLGREVEDCLDDPKGNCGDQTGGGNREYPGPHDSSRDAPLHGREPASCADADDSAGYGMRS